MTYVKGQWIDDDGSGTTGTSMSAARMGNIEQGIADAHYPPVVDVLPPNPVDGQLARLLADDGTYGGPFIWTLRFRQASASAYKWDVIDAQPLASGSGSLSVTPVNNNFFDAGAVIWLPFAGDWLMEASGNRVLQSVGSTGVYTNLVVGNGIGGTAGVSTWDNVDGGSCQLPSQYAASPFFLRDIRKSIPGGSNVAVRSRHLTANLQVTYAQVVLTATPLRLG